MSILLSSVVQGQGEGIAFHAKKAATRQRIIRRMYKPLTIHPGIPAMPQIANSATTTARISNVTAHENIFCRVDGLKRANVDEKR
jgi:hypothetical protein